MWSRIQQHSRAKLALLISLARRHSTARQIALGVAWGPLLGLLPKLNLLTIALVVAMSRIRVDLAAALASTLVFTTLGFCSQGFLHRTGYLALTWGPLVPLWTCLYNLPLLPWTRFNETCVMGGLIVGLYLFLPAYLFAKWLVEPIQTNSTPWQRLRRTIFELLLPVREILGLER